MKLLAIDASTKATGIAVFNDSELIHYECITSSSQDLIKRIHVMVDAIDTLIDKFQIEQVVVEEVIPDHTKNQNTFKALSWLQATFAVMMHDKHSKVKIEFIYPSSWRKVCGIKQGAYNKRDSLKEQDIAFANKTYNLNLTSDDIADAICIGHSFLNPIKGLQNGELNWG